MSPDEREEAPHELKILAPTAVRMRLIAISAAILVVGSALAPARQGALPSRTEERANPLIEEQLTTSTPVAVTFSGVQDAARTSRTHVVEIRPVRRAVVDDVRSDIPRGAPLARGGAGVMVSDGYVLTHAAALDGRLAVEVVTDEGRTEDVELAAYDPPSGLVLLKSAPGLTPAAVLASGPPEAGSLAVAVGHDERRPIAQPAFVTFVGPGHVVITPAGPGTAPGLPVFSMAGSLLGVMGLRGSGNVALASTVVDRLIASAAAGQMPRSFGLGVQRLDGVLARAFGTRGVLVSEVVPAGPAATAGLAAGDVLLGVDQADVTSLEGATRALAAAALGPATTLRTSRRGRERVLDVTAALSYSIAHLVDLVPAPATATSAGAVLPPVLRTTLGLSAEAAVLSINGVAVQTRVQADRALAARRPVDVLHVRDDRGARFVAIERAR